MPIPKGELVQQTEETAPIAEGNPIARAPSGIPKGEPVGQDVPTFVPDELKREEVEGDFMEKAGALGSAAISMGRQAAAEPAAGFWGLINLGLSSAAGREDPLSDAVQSIESLRDAVSGDGPQTPEGQAVLRNLSKDSRIQSLMEQARESGEMTLEATDSPAAATSVQTAMEFLPGLMGSKSGFDVIPRRGAQGEGSEIAPSQKGKPKEEVVGEPIDVKVRKQDLKRFRKLIKDEGIDTRNKRSLFNSLREIGENVQDEGFAQSLKKVRNAVVNARQVEKSVESRLWESAREGDEAFVSGESVVDFRRQLDRAVEPFVTEDMPKVTRLMQRLDKKVGGTGNLDSTKISELYRWRKSLNANMPSDKTSPEAMALTQMKRNLDNFIENQFATDMIKGDPESIARWKAAIDKTSEIKDKFSPDKVIKNFARNDITPKQLRSYLFNSSKVGANNSAEITLQRLKKILGPDSDEMVALRQESLFNVMEPLIKENPDFDAFSQRYNEFVKKNPELIKELFPEKARESLRLLNSAAKSAEKRQSIKEKYGSWSKAFADIGATGLFAHGIAQAGLRARIARTVFDRMLTAEGSSAQRDIMEDFLGYDPGKSILRSPAKRAAAIEGTVQAAAQEQEDDK